jgi:hypothetical protein
MTGVLHASRWDSVVLLRKWWLVGGLYKNVNLCSFSSCVISDVM